MFSNEILGFPFPLFVNHWHVLLDLHPFHYKINDDQTVFGLAEKPLDNRDQVEKRSIGISVVPMVSVQTQTSPKSSLSESDFRESVSEQVRKHDPVSLHK